MSAGALLSRVGAKRSHNGPSRTFGGKEGPAEELPPASPESLELRLMGHFSVTELLMWYEAPTMWRALCWESGTW